jgi:hypothetical protein
MGIIYKTAHKYFPLSLVDVEEVVQDSIIKMHKSYDEAKYTKSWLGLVTTSVALDRLRKKKHTLLDSESELDRMSYKSAIVDYFDDSNEYKEHLFLMLKLGVETTLNSEHKKIIKGVISGELRGTYANMGNLHKRSTKRAKIFADLKNRVLEINKLFER